MPTDPPALPPAEAPAPRIAPSRLRLGIALLVAVASDALSIWIELVPPLQLGVDVATALVLFSVLGFRWVLLPPLVIEAVPGLGLFPTWVLAVGAIVAGARARGT